MAAPFTSVPTREDARAAAERFAAEARKVSGRKPVTVNEMASLSVVVVHRRDLGVMHRFIYGGAPSEWELRPQ